MQRSEPVNVPRNLAAYIARQRRNERQRYGAAVDAAVTPGSRAGQASADQSAPPDYGCVEWFMYESRRARP